MKLKNKVILSILICIIFIHPSVQAKEIPITVEGYSGIENVNLIVSSGTNEVNLTFRLYDDGLHGDFLNSDNIFGTTIYLDRGVYNLSFIYLYNNISYTEDFENNLYVDTYSYEIQLRTIVLDDESYLMEIKDHFISKLDYTEDDIEFYRSFEESPPQIGIGKIYDLNHNFSDDWNVSENYTCYLKMDPIVPSGRIFTGTFRDIRKDDLGYYLTINFPVHGETAHSLDRVSCRVYIPEKKYLIKNLVIKYEDTYPDLIYSEGGYRILQFNNPRKIKNDHYEYNILIIYDYIMPWDIIILGFFSGLIGMFVTLVFERLMSNKIDKYILKFRKNR